MHDGWLALEDGAVYGGRAFGARGRTGGEVVFNTGMTGYQEILTDPSYAGQIVAMTYPLIGNYGINPDDFEADRPAARGLIVKEWCRAPSNWRCAGTVDAYLERHGLTGLEGVDTRALTRRLRSRGTMRGYLTTEPLPAEELVRRAREVPDLSGQDFVAGATIGEAYTVYGPGPRVVLIHYGAKHNIIRSLAARGCEVIVAPASISAAEVMALRPAGLMLSNGPGDPRDLRAQVETVRELLGALPVFGICLGHQILGLALGCRIYKLKYGHRGANHPVRDLSTGRVRITSQNHGFAVDAEALPPHVMVTHVNVNDGTVEGLRHTSLPAWSVQYHPEAAPGPADAAHLFDELMERVLSFNS
ncbi:MAG: glutamine-hydrolyzing carbamoyl-phosphate synthase small subunit [Bacteroidota bacterium]